jgi:hypothetical protein
MRNYSDRKKSEILILRKILSNIRYTGQFHLKLGYKIHQIW